MTLPQSDGSDPQRHSLPSLQSFDYVLAGPSPDRDTPAVQWPDFDAQMQARLWRGNRRVCIRPEIADTRVNRIAEPGMFVSMYDNHFGHMVAETISRLPQSLAEAPDLPLYFSAREPLRFADANPVFRTVLAWLNIPAQQIRFIAQPTEFRNLTVAAQAEHLNGPAAPDAYLPLLEARIAGQLDLGRPAGVTFVSRATLAPEKGRHAGEGYLADCLERLGVRVVYPEKLALPAQMAAYASAKYLVFSEGSAVHGRQLLGRVDQHISILRRRFRSQIAQNQMAPRAASLRYVASFAGALAVTNDVGRKITSAMISLYATGPVIEHFESLGVPLRKIWDHAAFNRARDSDVMAWVAAIYDPQVHSWLKPHNSDDDLLAQLEPLGLGHLQKPVQALIRSLRPNGGPSPASHTRAVGHSGAPDIAVQGETGIDIFCPLQDVGPQRPRYLCLATVVDAGGIASVQMHEPSLNRNARTLAQLAKGPVLALPMRPTVSAATTSDAAQVSHQRGGDAGSAFVLAWQQADAALQTFLNQLDRTLAALPAQPGALTEPATLLYNFNRITLGVQVARQASAVLSSLIASQQWPGGTRDSTGHAMRLLGDLCARGAEPALALTCYEIALHAGDNGFRRRRALAAARVLGDGAKMDLHLAAMQRFAG